MSPTRDTTGEYELLVARLKTLLPEQYQDSYDEVQPLSMGSAGLKYDEEGRVAWNEIWGSFCDLAMAGGPPHRGTLLAPATQSQIDREPERYEQVLFELCRGVEMVTRLAAEPSSTPGWIEIDCPNTGMAGWLLRAITMENISAHADGMLLHLPAGPHFRLEKEIKNVVTSIAKSCHYWVGHTSVAQHRAIATLFHLMEQESQLIQAPFPTNARPTPAPTSNQLRDSIAAQILAQTALQPTGLASHDWLGIDCKTPHSAIWMMRILVASNVLARREGNLLYIPVNPSTDPSGERVVSLVTRAYRIAHAQGVL